jgi:serine/threonine protein kinase
MIQDSPPFPRLDYDRLGLELRHDPAQKLNGIEVETPARTKEFLQAFLQINPANRITADEAIRHPYFADILNS